MVKALLAYKTNGTNEVPTVLYAGTDHDELLKSAEKVKPSDGFSRLEWIQVLRGVPVPILSDEEKAALAAEAKAAKLAEEKAAADAKEAEKARVEKIKQAAKQAAKSDSEKSN